MASTTHDCVLFLMGFVRENFSGIWSFLESNEVSGSFFESLERTALYDLRDTLRTSIEWKRTYKCKPGKGKYNFKEYDAYIFDYEEYIRSFWCCGPRNRKLETTKIPVSQVASERGFRLDGPNYGNKVQFVVIEDVDGKLHVANYIGE